jgi:diacylglycerol O-acyltransferase / wax synthase
MARRERQSELSPRMSEHEALMWNIEKDPWLNPSGASVILLDKPLDTERFRRQIRAGIAKTPRLYQRVVPGFARLSTPAWVADAEFDLDAHIREIVLPAPGTQRQLLDLAARLYAEPLDRTRPLWRFVMINGLEGGGSALYTMIHHSVSDGIGQLRISEIYQQLTRDEDAPPPVDLDGIIAEAVAADLGKESGGDLAESPLSALRDSTSHLVRRQIGIGRRIAGELALWPADPSRISNRVDTLLETVSSAVAQLRPSDEERASGSPLWKHRSRHRHLEWVRVPVADLKAATAVAGGTVNDAFMAGLAEAASRYHLDRGVEIDHVNSSFVLSTRHDSKAGGNAFTPVPVKLPAGPMSIQERMSTITETLAEAKQTASRTGGMTAISGVANLLPISTVTQTARAAASRIDFSTSNLRGAPFEVYCSGAKVLATIPMGPVAGTGANITALSLDGQLDIGIFIDPAAITEPEAFRTAIEASFADMFAAAVPAPRPRKQRAAKKTATKKRATKKRAAKKAATKKTAAKKRAATKK